ncbi:hypothetical protein DPMN_007468 [Dreissena polymorpha]|uniref:Uncharacterized protein n=1 Tax=Dreissena polymorpha TaxID=45954 RepID=A0A9D4MWK4_DREPO|nr:hypothetical protein DPMN_007468 [Dreissena polymorpha]
MTKRIVIEIGAQEMKIRKCLEGLNNEELKCEIEFHKEPKNIDEAVYYAINYFQIRSSGMGDRNGKHNARRVTLDTSENLDFRTNQRARDSGPMYRNRYGNDRFKSKGDIKPAQSGFEAEKKRDYELKA